MSDETDPAAPIERDPITEETVDITVPKWWADSFKRDLRTNLARWVTDTRRPSVPQPATVWVSSDMTDAELVAAVQTGGVCRAPEQDTATERRIAIAQASNRRGWSFGATADIVHSDGCRCEQADAWTMEMDPRCGTGPEYTSVTLDDGAYTQWIVNLDAFADAVGQTADWPDTAEGVLVTLDGACMPLAFIGDGAALHPTLQQAPDPYTEATRRRDTYPPATESHRWSDGPAVTRWAEESTEETP